MPEAFVPQQYAWGDEAQVDWYEADVDLDDERVTVQVFAMRSMASGAAFHRAYLRATQQAFLEAHELGFHYLGGTFRRLRYDNLGSAVKKILRGFRREETARFIAFRAHWNFEASFCTPGEGHEKGGVEGEVGTFRRNHLVPVPAARDLDDLNAMLLDGCREDEARHIDGRAQTVGEALTIERLHLLPLAREGFDLVEVSFGQVNAHGAALARSRTGRSSLASDQLDATAPAACCRRRRPACARVRPDSVQGRAQADIDRSSARDVRRSGLRTRPRPSPR